jgi:hypothetical protein
MKEDIMGKYLMAREKVKVFLLKKIHIRILHSVSLKVNGQKIKCIKE